MIFRYPGGKSPAQEQILRLFPDDTTHYREPFVGGGSVFWGVPTQKSRWVNDIDANLIEVYKALQENPDSFLQLCRQIAPNSASDPHEHCGARKVNARLASEFQRLFCDSTANSALRYWFLNRCGWEGRVLYDYPSRTTFSHPRGWDLVYDDSLMERVVKLLQGVRITSGDYEPLILEEGENVCIFCDPPYLRERASSVSQRLYASEFRIADHQRLAAVLHRCPHRVVLSYSDCEMVRDLYRDWHLLPTTWAYVGQSGKQKRRGAELLITNYETQAPPKTQAYFGRIGGRSTSVAKSEAARQNGLLGGRPPKRI